jgi:Domain of unknown function (DUF4907)
LQRYLTILFLFPCILSLAQHAAAPQAKTEGLTPEQTGVRNIVYKIIEVENQCYGYDIISNGQLLIHQPSIPAVPGNTGFSQRKDAEKVAKLVITKIKQGEFPPRITQADLKNLDIRVAAQK